jgi:hypothetical protein
LTRRRACCAFWHAFKPDSVGRYAEPGALPNRAYAEAQDIAAICFEGERPIDSSFDELAAEGDDWCGAARLEAEAFAAIGAE